MPKVFLDHISHCLLGKELSLDLEQDNSSLSRRPDHPKNSVSVSPVLGLQAAVTLVSKHLLIRLLPSPAQHISGVPYSWESWMRWKSALFSCINSDCYKTTLQRSVSMHDTYFLRSFCFVQGSWRFNEYSGINRSLPSPFICLPFASHANHIQNLKQPLPRVYNLGWLLSQAFYYVLLRVTFAGRH